MGACPGTKLGFIKGFNCKFAATLPANLGGKAPTGCGPARAMPEGGLCPVSKGSAVSLTKFKGVGPAVAAAKPCLGTFFGLNLVFLANRSLLPSFTREPRSSSGAPFLSWSNFLFGLAYTLSYLLRANYPWPAMTFGDFEGFAPLAYPYPFPSSSGALFFFFFT